MFEIFQQKYAFAGYSSYPSKYSFDCIEGFSIHNIFQNIFQKNYSLGQSKTFASKMTLSALKPGIKII